MKPGNLGRRSLWLSAMAGTFLIAACGQSGNSSPAASGGSSTTAQKVDRIANEVPSAIRSKGTLVVASDATYAPMESIASDGKTVEGADADLANALAEVMGLNINIQNVKFDNILPGIQGGHYDVGISSFTDTKDREQVVDFVTYFTAGTSFFIKTGGPTINSLADLCGHTVSVETGTTEESDANTQKAQCRTDRPLTVLSFPDQNQTNLALQSGRADVSMADSPVAAYQVKQSNGQFQLTGQAYGSAPYGIALPKGNGMAQPVLDAIKELMNDGVYANILNKWGLSSGAINNPGINQAAS